MGDEPPRPIDLAEKEGCYQTLLLVRVEATVLAAEAAVESLGPVVEVLVDLPHAGVDDHAGLAGAFLCAFVVNEGFFVD